jgi:hypothetical protein
MNRQFSRQARNRAGNFLPRLEALEDRLVPTCTVVHSGPALSITGSAAADKVKLTDDGTRVTVQCDNAKGVTYSGITAINVSTKGGNDSVSYNLVRDPFLKAFSLPGLLVNPTRALNVSLGTGADKFAAAIEPYHMTAGTSLSFNISGGSGADALSVDALSAYPGGYSLLTVDKGAAFNVYLDGGTGADKLTAWYKGENDGNVSLQAAGSTGNDKLDIYLRCIATAKSHSEGFAFLRGWGNDGGDFVKMFTHKDNPSDPVGIDALIDGGGGGFDTAYRTVNYVDQVNCEKDFKV